MEPAAIGDRRRVGRLARQDLLVHGAVLRHHRQQRLGVRVDRCRQQLLGRADLDDAAEVHHGDTVGDVPRQPEVVRDDEHRHLTIAGQPEQQVEDLAPDRSIEARHRLVGDQKTRLEHHRPGDHHPLPLPAGELVGVAQEVPLGRPQSATCEGVRHPPLLVVVDAVDAQSFGHDLVHRLARVEAAARVLEHELGPPPERSLRRLVAADGRAVEGHRTARQRDESEQGARQRRLAASRLTRPARRSRPAGDRGRRRRRRGPASRRDDVARRRR